MPVVLPHIFSRRRTALVAVGSLSVGFVAYAVAAAGVSPTEPASTCRASLARITLGGQVLAEPFIANDAGAPCTAENADLIGDFDLDPLPVSGRLLYTRTNAASPQAETGVADLTIALGELIPGAPTLGVQVLTSEAGVACNNGTPSSSGHSRVVGLSVDGEDQLVIPPDDAYTEIPVDPLINVKLNEQVRDGNTVTQRALHINALAGNVDIVVAEAIAGFTGNPCGTTVTDSPSASVSPSASPSVSPSASPSASPSVSPSTSPSASPSASASPSPSGPPIVGWMTGGGQLNNKVSHSLVLPCTMAQAHPGPQLTVDTPNGKFRLTSLTSVSCRYDVSQGAPYPPTAGFNTLEGTGVGTCGKVKNVQVTFRFTDEGEPNKGADEAHITISGSPCATQADGTVNGDQQAHKGNNPPA